jgi:hypothetical protein
MSAISSVQGLVFCYKTAMLQERRLAHFARIPILAELKGAVHALDLTSRSEVTVPKMYRLIRLQTKEQDLLRLLRKVRSDIIRSDTSATSEVHRPFSPTRPGLTGCRRLSAGRKGSIDELAGPVRIDLSSHSPPSRPNSPSGYPRNLLPLCRCRSNARQHLS